MDVIRVEIDAIRAHGVSPWLSMRMNDNHDSNDVKSWLHSKFWVEHPEYHKWGGFNYSIPAVQDYHFAFIEEMLERYDVDGFECGELVVRALSARLSGFLRLSEGCESCSCAHLNGCESWGVEGQTLVIRLV